MKPLGVLGVGLLVTVAMCSDGSAFDTSSTPPPESSISSSSSSGRVFDQRAQEHLGIFSLGLDHRHLRDVGHRAELLVLAD